MADNLFVTPAPPSILHSALADICKQQRGEKTLSGLITIAAELTLLISLSHIIHFFLRRLGQPSVVSQMLAGVVVGKSVLGHLPFTIPYIQFTSDHGVDEHLTSLATISRILFMFLVGLELDVPYVLRNARRAAVISSCGAVACSVLGLASTPLVYPLVANDSAALGRYLFAVALSLVLSSTASPIVIRLAAELKLAATESGRLLVAAALVNDAACLLVVALLGVFEPAGENVTAKEKVWTAARLGALIGGSAAAVRPGVRWLNKRNAHRGEISGTELAGVLACVVAVSTVAELMGYNSSMASFLMGLVFPRTGATARTVVAKLSYSVRNLVLPVYFGYAGVQTDVTTLRRWEVAAAVTGLVVVGTAGKVGGSVAGARLIGMTTKAGIVFGLLLNVKGHVDLILMSLATKYGIWGERTYMALLLTVLLNNIMAGPAAAYLIRRERRAQRYRSMGLEWLQPESELRVLACVHTPADATAMLNLLEISSAATGGSHHAYRGYPLAAYLLHLVHLTRHHATDMLYRQDVDYDGHQLDPVHDAARQIGFAADAFADQTGIPVHQITAVSPFDTMHRDVCNAAQDVWSSLVILPFHRRLRLDGRMGVGKDGVQLLNRCVLRDAPCSVAVLVDRGMSSHLSSTSTAGSNPSFSVAGSSMCSAQEMHHVAVVFFGGPDDREAVAFSGRLAMHPNVSVTVFRFVAVRVGAEAGSGDGSVSSTATLRVGDEVPVEVKGLEEEAAADEEFMADFYTSFVAAGTVTYAERLVGDARETVEALAAMDGKYSLYVVGKGRRIGAVATLTKGMAEWVECPEIGSIGDLLASSDFITVGSVLVVQQHRVAEERGGPTEESTSLREEELVDGGRSWR
ncbi:hypothetical protein HPP92_025892 [Vanilla planifolia]|uniref:Cation/H+ exchanger domain-containing protein n=1 Tax=Vanilla planifolia TaxID=51239 RepID=A0A835PKW7_VANPL|nr:hypothetical protein HPP92_025892 [Vanilla planifolia]